MMAASRQNLLSHKGPWGHHPLERDRAGQTVAMIHAETWLGNDFGGWIHDPLATDLMGRTMFMHLAMAGKVGRLSK